MHANTNPRQMPREHGHRAPRPTVASGRRDPRDLRLPMRERRGGRRQRVMAAALASASGA